MRQLELRCNAIITEGAKATYDELNIGFVCYCMSDETQERLRIDSGFLNEDYDENGELKGFKIFVFYDRNPELDIEIQIDEIIEYVRGQLSDELGDDTFTINGQCVGFDYDSLDFFSDEYCKESFDKKFQL